MIAGVTEGERQPVMPSPDIASVLPVTIAPLRPARILAKLLLSNKKAVSLEVGLATVKFRSSSL